MKIPFSFLNHPDEWHSFVIGACQGFTWFKRAWTPPRGKALWMINREYWYYAWGRAVGFTLFALSVVGLAKLISIIF